MAILYGFHYLSLLVCLTISFTAEALVRPRGVDAALRAGPGHVGALVHVVAPRRVVRPREVTPVAAALEPDLPGVILLIN